MYVGFLFIFEFRFSQLWGRSHSREDDLEEDQHQQDKISSTNNSLPKSVSLPAIAAVQNNKANSSSSAFSSKYTYKSSVQEQVSLCKEQTVQKKMNTTFNFWNN